MYGLDRNIYFTMIPALSEIEEYDGDNLYYCGLEKTRQSIDTMVNAAIADFLAGEDSSDPNWLPRALSPSTQRVQRLPRGFPGGLFNLAISLSASGMGVGIYKLIDLWVKAKNGRKIHVKLADGLVVDATQMTHEEFSEFLSKVYEIHYRQHPGDHKRLGQYVKSKKIKKVDAERSGNRFPNQSSSRQKEG